MLLYRVAQKTRGAEIIQFSVGTNPTPVAKLLRIYLIIFTSLLDA